MRKPLLAILWCVLPLCACARVQTFRVVDAETGQPVHGVQAERFADVARATTPGIAEPLSLPVEVSSTNIGGVATFRGSGQQFSLRKEGYEQVSLRSTMNGVVVRYERTGEEIPAERVEGMTYVPLRRAGGAAPSASATATTAAPKFGVTPASYNAAIPQNATTSKNTAVSPGAAGSRLK